MKSAGHRCTRRQKKSLRIAPLAPSQSLDVVAAALPSSVAQRKEISRDGYNYYDTLENPRGMHKYDYIISLCLHTYVNNILESLLYTAVTCVCAVFPYFKYVMVYKQRARYDTSLR